jgi:mRNA interferase MazF
MPYRFRIIARAQLLQDSDACINEVRALSRERIKQVLGQVSDQEYSTITNALCQLLGKK